MTMASRSASASVATDDSTVVDLNCIQPCFTTKMPIALHDRR
jgi:hypothetical protein